MARTVILAGTLLVVGIVLTGLSAVQLGVARAAAKWPSARPPRLGRGPALFGMGFGIVFTGAAGALAATLVPVEGALWIAAVAGAGVLLLAAAAGIAARLASRVELKALISTPTPAYVAIAPRGEPLPAITARSDVMAAPQPQPATGTYPNASTVPVSGQQSTTSPFPSGPTGTYDTSPPSRSIPYAARGGEPIRPWDEPELAVPAEAEPGWVYTDADGTFLLVVDIDTPENEGRRLVRLADFTLASYGSVREPLTVTGSIEISVWPLDD